MNENELFEAIGEADDKLLANCEEKPVRSFAWVKWASLAAAGIAVCIAAANIIPDDDIPVEPGTQTSASSTEESVITVTSTTTANTTVSETEAEITEITTVITTETESDIVFPPFTEPTTTDEPAVTVTTAPLTSETTSPTQIHLPSEMVEASDTTVTENTTTVSSVTENDEFEVIVPITSESTASIATTEPELSEDEFIEIEEAVQLLAAAEYPEIPPYVNYDEPNMFDEHGNVDWDAMGEASDRHWEAIRAQVNQSEGYNDGFDEFCGKTITEFLKSDGESNVIYSPMNLYMALGTLAEVTDGSSRSQILDLLGVDNTAALQNKVYSLWNANYCNDGLYTCTLANSLWLNEAISFRQETLDILADKYYASTYSGEMGSDEMNYMLRRWINKNTGNFLQQQANRLSLSPDTAAALASTVYFSAQWANGTKFDPDITRPYTFTTISGDELTCDFMYDRDYGGVVFSGSNFTAISRDFQSFTYNARMWFILPDERVTTNEVLAAEDMLTMINSDPYTISSAEYQVEEYGGNIEDYNPAGIEADRVDLHVLIPKFDVTYESDMKKNLEKLGVTHVFNPETADYSPLTDQSEGIYLSKVQQAVRVSIDEEGCKAASFILMPNPGTGGVINTYEPYNFTLDRPFIFCITGTDHTPLFIGVVNNPNQ